MKHIQLYEGFLSNIFKRKTKGISFSEFKPILGGGFYRLNNKFSWELDCSYKNLIDLKGIEKLVNIEELSCYNNLLKNLDGIENCKKLLTLLCQENQLENLHGIENLKNLEILYCNNNNLKNLDEIKFPNNLKLLRSHDNPFEFPLNKIFVERWGLDRIYGNKILEKFKSYDFQKMFLTEHPERVKDLEPFGFNERIKQEFPALIRGSEWGFFDLERSER